MGNDIGYDSIVGGGPHATTLHWIENSGPITPGELVLLDMGVEGRNLYTADVTRTLPVDGTFTDLQRELYDLVHDAQEAGIEAVRPGVPFTAPHEAAMTVLAHGLDDLGLLPVSVEEALSPDSKVYSRWTLHGTSHMLGMDVHDCGAASPEAYAERHLAEGMVLTVEPGLYFQEDDLLVPEELRGIGIRIEDDIVVTGDGSPNLSASLPRTSADVEAWMARAPGLSRTSDGSSELGPDDLAVSGDDLQAPRRGEGGDQVQATAVLLGLARGLRLGGPGAGVEDVDAQRGRRCSESRIRHEESACVTAFVASSLVTRSASSSSGSSSHSVTVCSTNLRAAATLVSACGRSSVASVSGALAHGLQQVDEVVELGVLEHVALDVLRDPGPVVGVRAPRRRRPWTPASARGCG